GCIAAGGNGGGAVKISARGALTVSGSVRANGEDGSAGCPFEGGGSGGGSGGGVLLEGASVSVSGAVEAQGGRGGNGAGGGGSGGNGSTSAGSPGDPGITSLTNGGGAGGGGYGRVHQRVGGAASNELACAGSSLAASLSAGTTYYLVVKGDNSSDAGPYSLSVTGAPDTIPGCDDDSAAADALFEFSVASPRTVQLDTSGSSLDTVLALFDDSDTLLGCDDDSAGGGASRLTQALSAGTYYAVLRPKNGTATGLPYQLSIRDNDGLGAIACADGAATTGGSLSQALPAGDYIVALTGQTGDPTGSYSLSVNDDSSYATWLACDTATDAFSYDLQAGHHYFLMVKGDTPGAAGAYGLSLNAQGAYDDLGCGADPASHDAFYRFTLDQQTRVRVDTIGSALDTVVGIFPAGTTTFDASRYAIDADGNPVPCDDDSGGGGTSLLEAELVPGAYYVVVKSDEPPWLGGDLPFRLSVRDEGALGALACAAPGGSITEVVQPGTYTVALSSDGTTGGAYEIRFANQDVTGAQDGTPIACGDSSGLTANVQQGTDYYLVVKGDTAGDAGPYDVIIEDALSTAGTAANTPIACTDSSSTLQTTIPPGDYFAVVKGTAGSEGDYILSLADGAALMDANRLACDDDGGPNGTSAIEADLMPGSYWVVVKGDGPADSGNYQLNVRDLDTFDDNRLACSGPTAGSRVETSLSAGQDYTLLMKGTDGEQGAYNVKMYDADNLTAGGSLLGCSDNNGTLSQTLSEGVYYLALKGDRIGDRGVFQFDMGDTAVTSGTNRTYNPPVWTQNRSVGINGTVEALNEAGMIVLPVMSGGGSDALNQARGLATATGAVLSDGTPIVKQINADGSGLGDDLVTAVADLAQNLTLDIGVRAVYEPDAGASGFVIGVTPVAGSPGCDAWPTATLQTNCLPGSTPQFDVTFQNPGGAPVPDNPTDPLGGYHFRLELVGNGQYVLDSVPVYIIPDAAAGPPPPNSVAMSGQYTRDMVATGCSYLLIEGEGSASDACSDGADNDGDGLADRGVDTDGDGTYEIPPDPDCAPGSCSDGLDNDGDGDTDAADSSCRTNQFPNWTDLFFDADLPPGTSISFEACSAETEAALDGCSFGTVATVVSNGATCVVSGDCLGLDVGGVTRDGYCTSGGRCQFIDPQTSRPFCLSDADCDIGNYQGHEIRSSCDLTTNECVYSTVPANIGAALELGTNLQPYLRSRVTLYSNSTASYAPTLYDFWITYECTNAQ
ncbi:MAG: PPC domain-containing protein, partial [Myxococcales bacterium]|nr:PPC domain-containing protein [Myxococcales bacterium]